MRIGQGYDAHKLVPGNGVILGGVEIDCDYSIEAHSDGGILIHALIDALLGAAAYGDLGTFFPSNDESFRDISSVLMLEEILKILGLLHRTLITLSYARASNFLAFLKQPPPY